MKDSNQCIIITAWEYGAGKQGTSEGPASLLNVCKNSKNHPFNQYSVFSVPQEIDENEKIPLPKYLKRAIPFIRHQEKHAQLVYNQLELNKTPIILSGDHSNAVGGLAGFSRYFGTENSGIVWIDAHLDLHSPYTTPSGNIHGMALNTALNCDNLQNQVNDLDATTIELWEKIKALKNNDQIQNFKPQNIVFIGIRSFEDAEIKLTQDLGIHVITANEVHEKGISWAIEKAFTTIQSVNQIYLSFDVDSLDPEISQGTGTPVENGLHLDQAKELLHSIWNNPKVKTLEFTEINPTLESNNEMATAICRLIQDSFVD
jgi:arginase